VNPDSPPKGELRLAFTLAGVIALRMLGLFMILPVFMILAREVPGFTPLLGGLAVGIYGLTQALLQQPFGWLSDIWGRRRVLLLGMALFALGGIVAALAETMTMLIIGRCLQGSGAIAGVAMAFAADHIRPARRSLSMAIIGMGIGGAFLLSMIVSVPLANQLGLDGLFWLTAGLAVLGMGLVLTTPTGPPLLVEEEEQQEPDMKVVWLLSLSVFLLHAVMTQLFVVLPGLWVDTHQFALENHWKIYVPTMIGSIALMLPVLARTGKNASEQKVLLPSFLILGMSMMYMTQTGTLGGLAATLLFYFMAFNVLEACMPALVARFVGSGGRGRRMGLYSTFQFLGAFAGGVSGGWVLGTWGASAALVSAASICVIWAVVILGLSKGVFRTSGPD
jgi:MFS family permease